jgi:HAD superfamily hydrolase (TIGR01509 family)
MSLPAAFLFDMDELLIESSGIWRKAEIALLAALGHKWSPELAAKYKGMNALDVAATIHRELRPSQSLEFCQRLLRETLLQSFHVGPIHPMPGATQLIKRLYGVAPIAVASGSPLEAIELAMESLGLREYIDACVSSESVAQGKPHPDVFLAAAQKLNAPPERCIVFEDSLHGVKAGKAAGMMVVSVPSGQHDEICLLADHVFDSLADIDKEHLLLKLPQ